MSLFAHHGPLGPEPKGIWSEPPPQGLVYLDPFGRRLRALRDGTVVIDTERALIAHQAGRLPRFVIPVADVADGIGKPYVGVAGLDGHVRVHPDEADTWMEEQAVLPHGLPRNPFHRVDSVATDRRLHVAVGGTTLVDTTDTMAVFETALAPCLYVAPKHVRMDLLVRSDTSSWCPYKGTASYWTAVAGDVTVPDAAWSYDDPLPGALPIAGYLSFYNDRATILATY